MSCGAPFSMRNKSYIIFFLSFLLLIFTVVLCAAFFSLCSMMPSPRIPLILKIFIEIFVYLSALFFFYSQLKVDLHIWIRAFVIFAFIRLVMGFSIAAIVSIMPFPGRTSFNAAVSEVFYNFPAAFIMQVLVTPFLAFPIVLGYIKTRKNEIFEQQLSIELRNIARASVPISPTEIACQVIPARLWKQFIDEEDRENLRALMKGIDFSEAIKRKMPPTKHIDGIISGRMEKPPVQPVKREKAIPVPLPSEKSEPEKKVDKVAAPEIEPPAQEATKILIPVPQKPAQEIVDGFADLDSLLQEVESAGGLDTTPQVISEKPTEEETPVSVEEVPGEQIAEIVSEVAESTEAPKQIEADASAKEPPKEEAKAPIELPDILTRQPISERDIADMKPQDEAKAGSTDVEEKVYTITSEDDFFKIPIRKLIAFNENNAGARVLERLVKRGANFVLSIPMRLLIPQLRQGKASVTIEYIYSEIPIELVNFMSADQSGDLSELEMELPIQEIFEQTDPKVIFGEEGETQEQSKWVQKTAEMNVEQIFGDSATRRDERIAVEKPDEKKLDLTLETELPVVPFDTSVKPAEDSVDLVLDNLKQMASKHGAVVSIDKFGLIDAAILSPVGVDISSFVPFVEWLATTLICEKWANTPCHVFIETEMVSCGIAIASGKRTTRDVAIYIAGISEIAETRRILNEIFRKMVATKGIENIDMKKIKTIDFIVEKELGDIDGYYGASGKMLDKSITVISSLSKDREYLSELGSIGIICSDFLSAGGMVFQGWHRVILCAPGWILGIIPMKGGVIVMEFAEQILLHEVPMQIQRLKNVLLEI